MENINEVVLQGHIGKDPEIRESKFGPVANFSLATNESRKSVNGTFEKVTLWHRIIGFGKLADFVRNNLIRGCGCYIKGKLRYGEYLKNDVKVFTTEIVASEIKLIEKENNDSELNEQPIQSGQTQPRYQNDSLQQVVRASQSPNNQTQSQQRNKFQPASQPRTISKGYQPVEMDDDIPF